MSNEPEVINRWEIGDGVIEQLQRADGQLYYRACAKGYCRYAEDLWMVDLYLKHLQAR
jgi:hypothetical protein